MVTAKSTRAPIAGALVRIHHGGAQDEIERALTGVAGRLRAEGLIAGEGGILVVPREQAMSRWRGLEREPGGTVGVDVEVDAGWELAGGIRDAATGDPIAWSASS